MGGGFLEGHGERVPRGDSGEFFFPLQVSSAQSRSTGLMPQTQELQGARSAELLWDGSQTFQGFPCSPGRVRVRTAQSPNSVGCPLSPDTVQVMDLEQYPELSRVFPVPSGTGVAVRSPRAVWGLQHCVPCLPGMVGMGCEDNYYLKKQVCVSPSPRNCSRCAGFRSEELPSPQLTALLCSGSARPEVLNICI